MFLYGAISVGLSALATALIPHTHDLYCLLGLFFVNGYLWGAIEAGGNVMLLQIWGKGKLP